MKSVITNEKIKIGIIGFGRMGGKYLRHLLTDDTWEVAYICDTNPESRNRARVEAPMAHIVSDEREVFQDASVQAVVLCTLADARRRQIEEAVAYGKHIIAEKPIADTVENEWNAVATAERSAVLSTVNLYLRNSWYHRLMRSYIEEGEIGELAILRICHMTPGLAPGEGHEYEGPAFHDCGMHYVDLARWYANAEFKTWHAQGIRMWNYHEPWWLQCHGTFRNGVVFDITQGFVYGQLSKDQTHNSYIDIIGTKGIVRMTHDFKTAVVDLHGVNRTERTERPFGGKNIDIMCRLFAESIRSGRLDESLPTLRDSAVASEYAWRFLEDARRGELPSVGSLETLDEIRRRRAKMTDGYGLLHRR